MYWERFDAAKAAADKRARKRTNSKGYVTRVPICSPVWKMRLRSV